MNSVFSFLKAPLQVTADARGDDFIPYLCSTRAVFALVLLGELFVLVLVLASTPLAEFSWNNLALTSILVQWIILLSAAALCPLRPRLRRLSPTWAGLSCYATVLIIAVLFCSLGQWWLQSQSGVVVAEEAWGLNLSELLRQCAIAALVSGVVLRYLYVQQQLVNQQQAELHARIQALQSRIRPHFLFNSMNSIASLIAIDAERAERMVEDLSALFRASLAESTLVTVAQELDMARHYMDIEQQRLQERLQQQWSIDDEAAQMASIPSLTLQPLLENAIYHGIQNRTAGGSVVVSITRQGSELLITISNPLARTDHNVHGGGHKGHSMALANIRHRLAAYFGAAASLNTERNNDTFTATVRLPCRPIDTLAGAGSPAAAAHPSTPKPL